MFVAAFAVLAVVHYTYRRARAKAAAEQWLRMHHYRLRSLTTPWFRMTGFATSWLRNSNNAFDFQATVEDTQLGGTGTVFLRVWMDWVGEINDEIEVVWGEMPEGHSGRESAPLWERLADAQLGVLRRVAGGETALYAPRNLEASGTKFSELVEHVQALSRCGMLTCGEPRLDGRSNQCISIGDLAVTEDGKRWLESQKPGYA